MIFIDKIDNLFSGKIGNSSNEEEFQKICKQVKSRFEQKQPPGYKDQNKSKDIEKYGDAILWLQVIDYAKTKNKPIIFITDDVKEDWWKRHEGKTISPRPELIQEIKTKAKVDFWMYTGDRFLMYAGQYLKLLEEPEVAKEAKEIRVNYDVPFQFTNSEKLAQAISLYRDEQLLMNNKSFLESLDAIRKQIPTIEASVAEKLAKIAKTTQSFQINNSEIIAKAIKDIEMNHPNLRKLLENKDSRD